MGRTSRKEFVRQLADAICAGDLQTIEKILDSEPDLINAGTDPNQGVQPGDAHAMRMIHLAIAEAKVEVVRLLIERGVDLNVRNADGRLPLHDCFELDHDDFAKILLDAGAEPDVCAAAVYGMHDTLRQILKSDRKNANDLTTGESPLGWSAYGQQPKSAEILFKHGAVVDFAPYEGHAWRPAAMVASTDVTRVLLDHGANPNWLNDGGNRPMHCAITSRIVLDPTEFVEIPLDSGADPGIRNSDGRTPLDEAMLQTGKSAQTYFPVRPIGRKHLEETIKILRSALARPS